jgi:hypothetical protein
MFSVRTYRILIAIVIVWGGIAKAFAALAQATPLEDGAGSTISFESVTPKRIKDFVEPAVADKAAVTGRLSFPESMTSPVRRGHPA